MNPTTLRAVAATLQAAPEGSRELDARCARAIGRLYGMRGYSNVDFWLHAEEEFCSSPPWTTSLDASRALAKELLPSIMISSSCYKNECSATVWIFLPEVHAKTEPLACMAAILLALAAKIAREANAPVCEAVG